MSALTASLGNYKLVRGCFISTFKRDKLKTAANADQVIIRGGNPTAHGGGAIVGTQLYEGAGGRSDKEAYVELYGLGPLSVLTTSEPPTAPHPHRKATPVVQALIGLEHCCVEQPRLHRFFGQEN